MGIKSSALGIIARLKCKDILSLSYPDLVMTKEACEEVTGIKPTKFNDSHKWHGLTEPLPETLDVFEQLGSQLTCIDIVASRGVETVTDLNFPHELGQYDLVLDCGTTEHCFNIGQALLNAANAVKLGGYIMHTPPLSMVNHGFYCLQPTLFYDFYTQNGWEILAMSGEVNNKWFDVDALQRILVPQEASLFILAQKNSEQELKFPMQSKYLNNPALK